MPVNVHMKSTGECSIGDIAQRFDLPPHVLRHWESVGLLAPARDSGGQRRYGDGDLVRVAVILMAKEAGFGLRDLRTLLTDGSPMDYPELLRRHIAVLDDRIAKATAAKQLIEHALACPVPFDDCQHAQEQIAARIPARRRDGG